MSGSRTRRLRRLDKKLNPDQRTATVQITYREMQSLFHAIRALDQEKDVSFSLKVTVGMAVNLTRLEPQVRGIEKFYNKTLTDEKAKGDDETLAARIEQIMTAHLDTADEIDLREFKATELDLPRNKVRFNTLANLRPIIEGLEEMKL